LSATTPGDCLQQLGVDVRAWRPTDVAALTAAWVDEEIVRFNGVPPDTSAEFAERWIAGAVGQTLESPSIDLVVEDKHGAVIGEVGLRIDRSRGLAEVGFWVLANARRQGVATRLLLAAELLAAPLGDLQLFALTASDNMSAIAVLESRPWDEVDTTTSEKRAFRYRPTHQHT